MAEKKKVFVSFDEDKDKAYYDMLESWCCNDDIVFVTQSQASEVLNTPKALVTRMKSTIDKFNGVQAFILLVSENTRNLGNSMLIDINMALSLNIPIIAVNINGLRYIDENNCPSILKDKNSLHVSFNSKIIAKALEVWPEYHSNHKDDTEKSPRYFTDKVYSDLGIE